ncbi:hypothetical protein CKO31_02290 [Thiohalocapsa halophila]|uniref:Uncharacterized protein n=1 Tax=Thiohalocapsa halophila TaxID=69359 RepID=A0ABS1CCE6_9GAMM|nr:hypothetical protein [Thiohalocapsa halophila]MBK1629586.1 hypothetical protein [Thiohalocapsa halophila]
MTDTVTDRLIQPLSSVADIRPFLLAGDVGKKGAGLLRAKPNIKWTKDRGKDVESAPWFHRFNGERINDHHLTLAEKRATRSDP